MNNEEREDCIVLPRDVIVMELGERLPWIDLGERVEDSATSHVNELMDRSAIERTRRAMSVAAANVKTETTNTYGPKLCRGARRW